MHQQVAEAKRRCVTVSDVFKLLMQFGFDPLAPATAARNARLALDTERQALAAVDGVVARLHRHDAAARPAA